MCEKATVVQAAVRSSRKGRFYDRRRSGSFAGGFYLGVLAFPYAAMDSVLVLAAEFAGGVVDLVSALCRPSSAPDGIASVGYQEPSAFLGGSAGAGDSFDQVYTNSVSPELGVSCLQAQLFFVVPLNGISKEGFPHGWGGVEDLAGRALVVYQASAVI